MGFKPFSDADDLMLLRERGEGSGWDDLARLMHRNKDTLKRRHLKLTGSLGQGGREGRARIARSGCKTPSGPPILDMPEPVDDERHVARLCQLGGFRPLSIYAQRYGITA